MSRSILPLAILLAALHASGCCARERVLLENALDEPVRVQVLLSHAGYCVSDLGPRRWDVWLFEGATWDSARATRGEASSTGRIS